MPRWAARGEQPHSLGGRGLWGSAPPRYPLPPRMGEVGASLRLSCLWLGWMQREDAALRAAWGHAWLLPGPVLLRELFGVHRRCGEGRRSVEGAETLGNPSASPAGWAAVDGRTTVPLKGLSV